MPGPVPATSAGRPSRQGKIRWGVKAKSAKGKTYAKAIDTFRFTSTDKLAIEQVAVLYGGEPSKWDETSAAERNQWQVITNAKDIEVWLPPGQMFKGYEHWQGGTCERRCDGVTVQIPSFTPDGVEMVDQPCMCLAKGEMTCKPKIRLNVILPSIPLGGVWLVESSSWNAWHEMPDIAAMLQMFQGDSPQIEPARLLLTDQSKKVRQKDGKVMTKRFKVPKLILPRSAQEIMSGVSGLPQIEGRRYEGKTLVIDDLPGKVPQIGQAPEVSEVAVSVHSGSDIVDAVLVEDDISTGPWSTIGNAARDGVTRDQLEKRDGAWHMK